MHKFRKHILLISIALFLGVTVFAFPQVSHAQMIQNAIVGSATIVFKLFAYLLNTFFSFLFILAGSLTTFALQLNLSVSDPQINGVIPIVWNICRDIANLGFVLVMIMIAFSTIIRLENYGFQKLFFRFLTAAVLVNFSLTIGGVIIDFSNVLTGFFLSKIGPTTTFGLTDALTVAFGPQKFLLGDTNDPLPPDPNTAVSAFQAFSAAAITSLTGLVFVLAFTIISTIVMLTLAVMLIVRYVYLTILLCLSPIAWLFYALPLAGLNNKWWDKFIQWTFFAPASTFFIYLALTAIQIESKLAPSTDHFFQQGFMSQIMTTGTKGIILSGLMVGGLLAANMASKTIAGTGIGATKGVLNGAKVYASSNARLLGQRLAQSKVGAATSRSIRVAGLVTRRIPGLKGLGGKINTAGQKLNRFTTKPIQRPGLMSSVIGGAFKGAFKKPEKKEADEKPKVKATEKPTDKNPVTPPATATTQPQESQEERERREFRELNERRVAAMPTVAGDDDRTD